MEGLSKEVELRSRDLELLPTWYGFCKTSLIMGPLRLTPRFQKALGLAVSDWIIREEAVLSHFVKLWRRLSRNGEPTVL